MGATYTCDECGKVINEQRLTAVVFQKDEVDGSQSIDCCSWRCLLRKLATVDTDYFVVLPYLHFDDVPEGQRVSDFWDAVREWGQK
jgi:hypothetical protein